jgi:hypothetical protein
LPCALWLFGSADARHARRARRSASARTRAEAASSTPWCDRASEQSNTHALSFCIVALSCLVCGPEAVTPVSRAGRRRDGAAEGVRRVRARVRAHSCRCSRAESSEALTRLVRHAAREGRAWRRPWTPKTASCGAPALLRAHRAE